VSKTVYCSVKITFGSRSHNFYLRIRTSLKQQKKSIIFKDLQSWQSLRSPILVSKHAFTVKVWIGAKGDLLDLKVIVAIWNHVVKTC